MSFLSVTAKSSDIKNLLDSTSNFNTETKLPPNTFHYWNGDEYTGQFVISKEKQKTAMEGKGIYQTSDGQTYEGLWENDYLTNECKITFADKSVFTGNLEDMIIEGPGKYKFKQNVIIEGHFTNNKLIGDVYLKDPNGHIWKGKPNKNGTFVYFYPLHPFWQALVNFRSQNVQMFYGEAAEELDIVWN